MPVKGFVFLLDVIDIILDNLNLEFGHLLVARDSSNNLKQI